VAVVHQGSAQELTGELQGKAEVSSVVAITDKFDFRSQPMAEVLLVALR